MDATAPLLRVQNLSVTHVDAAHPSPWGVSFDVHVGEVVVLMGPSGSGKSTLTLTLNGLIPQTVETDMTGSVEVAGRDTRTTPVSQLSTGISLVFQDPDSQLVTGTVLDEVAFGLENLLLPASEVLERAELALRRVGLWHRRSWNPDLLSGGGRQRLAIACALAMRSRVIVLDEPTANLDPQGVADVHAALAELAADAEDRAIVLVEHNVDAALRFATRVLELDAAGRVVWDGAADSWPGTEGWVRSAPASPGRDMPPRSSVALPPDPMPARPGDAVSALGESESDAGPTLRSPRPTPAAASRRPEPPGRVGPAQRPSAGAQRPSTSDTAISVRNLVVRKHRDVVLSIPSLDIAKGSFTAIVGANGAGKTTLLQALGGVVPPPRGTVSIGGLDAGHASPRQLSSHVGFVFQNPEHQFIAATVREELAFGLKLQRVDRAEVDQRVDEMLDRFGLAYKADEHPFLLSGGEKRRLSVGTALITRPAVVALDEPTFGQDAERATELLDLLQDLQRAGTTIVIVTHDLDLVDAYATHTIVLGDGELIAAGPTEEVLPQTVSAPTAGIRSSPVTEPVPTDPYASAPASARFWLHHLNPLAKLAAVVPAMALLVATRDLLTPALFLVLSYLLVLTGTRMRRSTVALLLLGMPAGIAVLTLGFGVWIAPGQVSDTAVVLRIGDWMLRSGALVIGLATALRLGAILALALVGGLSTSGPDLVRATVQQLHVPYRIGYTALAAYRFVPRFGYELGVIRAAHRVRGHGYGWPLGGRGPVARLVRGWGYIVPLLASGIRHAERVALSMDARAFGAHLTRTERHLVPWRTRDTVFTAAVLVVSAAVFIATFPWQL
ncbi:ATP-binding cassette domain-containing protein [uncultured Microbacterium sp.]|uniref:ATP-binding cassette domain-containing protein n=1 Tax=uncultured Microbacterium sp. TaxID=191216 RepID=UPI00345AFA52